MTQMCKKNGGRRGSCHQGIRGCSKRKVLFQWQLKINVMRWKISNCSWGEKLLNCSAACLARMPYVVLWTHRDIMWKECYLNCCGFLWKDIMVDWKVFFTKKAHHILRSCLQADKCLTPRNCPMKETSISLTYQNWSPKCWIYSPNVPDAGGR